jgi:hypothetical protein
MDVLDDSAQTVFSVPVDVFLAVDDDQRYFQGTYSYSDRGKLVLYPEQDRTKSYMAALLESSGPVSEASMELKRLVLSGAAKSGKVGDILKLKVKVSFTVPGIVKNKQVLRGGAWGLGGSGSLLRP